MSNQVVHKYRLNNDTSTIELRSGAKMLHVDLQRNEFNIWALEDLDNHDLVKRTFVIKATGKSIDLPERGSIDYIGSVTAYGGTYVFHVFEILDERNNGG